MVNTLCTRTLLDSFYGLLDHNLSVIPHHPGHRLISLVPSQFSLTVVELRSVNNGML